MNRRQANLGNEGKRAMARFFVEQRAGLFVDTAPVLSGAALHLLIRNAKPIL